ncbi:MAG: endoribonuclease MazF [Candidatus Aegiribacteria sp.]|nr:endoribonuclease MazF [Candidatus Aegiribacteria sp.]
MVTPGTGDLIWISFDPQKGSEQSGRRPALVLSPHEYNNRVGLALMCPITNRIKGYPFEVCLPSGIEITGVVLADQVKSLDWRARNAAIVGRASKSVIEEVLGKLKTLLNSGIC